MKLHVMETSVGAENLVLMATYFSHRVSLKADGLFSQSLGVHGFAPQRSQSVKNAHDES